MRRRAFAVGALLAGALAGCGATPLSVKQLRSSAGGICQLAATQGERVPGPTPPAQSAPSAPVLAQFLRSGSLILQRELVSLRTLKPASSSASQYATAISAMDGELAALRSSERSLERGGDAVIEIKALQARLTPLEERASASWQALGVQPCVGQ